MGSNHADNEKNKGKIKEFFSLGEVGGYFFRKKDPSHPTNINLKMMHGINKISIIIFLAGVFYLVIRAILRSVDN